VAAVTLPLSVEQEGRTWSLFAVEYNTADGTFQAYIYALCREHAEHICGELRESARVFGQVDGVVQ
jgi:hypothetical protein